MASQETRRLGRGTLATFALSFAAVGTAVVFAVLHGGPRSIPQYLGYLGLSCARGLDFLAHPFTSLVHNPVFGWGLLGLFLGALAGLSHGYRAAGSSGQGRRSSWLFILGLVALLILAAVTTPHGLHASP